MKVGLTGFPGTGKSTVFAALTGLAPDTAEHVQLGYAATETLGNNRCKRIDCRRADNVNVITTCLGEGARRQAQTHGRDSGKGSNFAMNTHYGISGVLENHAQRIGKKCYRIVAIWASKCCYCAKQKSAFCYVFHIVI